jgi:hypothetical protein
MDTHKLAGIAVAITRITAHLSRIKIILLTTTTSEGGSTLINVEARTLSRVGTSNPTYSDMVIMLLTFLYYSKLVACPKRWSFRHHQTQKLCQAQCLLRWQWLLSLEPVPSKYVFWTGLIYRLRMSTFYNRFLINCCRWCSSHPNARLIQEKESTTEWLMQTIWFYQDTVH